MKTTVAISCLDGVITASSSEKSALKARTALLAAYQLGMWSSINIDVKVDGKSKNMTLLSHRNMLQQWAETIPNFEIEADNDTWFALIGKATDSAGWSMQPLWALVEPTAQAFQWFQIYLSQSKHYLENNRDVLEAIKNLPTPATA